MAKEKMKRATKESLLARAQKRDDKTKYKEYNSKVLGETLLVKKHKLSRICEILDMADEENAKGGLELYKQLIYESVPILQDKELQEAYGCVEPYDIVTEILDDSLGEINKLAEFILEMYDLKDLAQNVKN